MQVKGTMITDYVKLVRSNPDKDWGRYLEDGDWEIINGQVLSSAWYPYEFFRRLGYAVFKEIAPGHQVACHLFDDAGAITTETPYTVSENILEACNVSKHFPIRKGIFKRVVAHVKAVDGVDLTIRRGSKQASIQIKLYEPGTRVDILNLAFNPPSLLKLGDMAIPVTTIMLREL